MHFVAQEEKSIEVSKEIQKIQEIRSRIKGALEDYDSKLRDQGIDPIALQRFVKSHRLLPDLEREAQKCIEQKIAQAQEKAPIYYSKEEKKRKVHQVIMPQQRFKKV